MNAFVLLVVVSRLYPPGPFEREEIDSAVKSHSPQMHSKQGIENRDEPVFAFPVNLKLLPSGRRKGLAMQFILPSTVLMQYIHTII
jgi:hypothetical protein